MSQILKQSTAFTFRLGPFVDSTDGNTQENALTIAAADVLLSKAGGALTAKTDATALTGTGANGHYTCVLDATDTGTLGALRVWSHITGALAVWHDFIVLPANVYDSIVAGTDLLDINCAQLLGTAFATPTVAGVPEVDLTHVAGATTNVAALATNVEAILTDTSATLETHLTDIKGATFAGATDSLEAIRDRGDSAWITATGFATSAALTTAQTDLDTITGADGVTLATTQGNYAPLRGGVAMTEAYAADGATATPEQMFYMLWAALSEFAISGTTITSKKLDGTATAMTFTLDSATVPTSRTRAT